MPAINPAPDISISASASKTSPDGEQVILAATLSGVGGTPQWTLEGPGRLSQSLGFSVQYVPPDSEAFNDATTVTITARAGAASRSYMVTLEPASLGGHQWKVVRPHAMNWQSVAEGGGAFVAIGHQGLVEVGADGVPRQRRVLYHSKDGREWLPRLVAGPDALVSATWGPQGWVVLSLTGGVLTSPDGVTWTDAPARLSQPGQGASVMQQVVYGNGAYVALAQFAAYASADGKTWSSNALPKFVGALAHGNGTFVATQSFLLGGPPALSQNGLTWTFLPPLAPPGPMNQIAFGNGRFVASNGYQNMATSADGLSWSTYSVGQDLQGSSLTFARNLFFALGSERYSIATDGIQWLHYALPDNLRPLVGIASNQSTFVRVSALGSIEASESASGPWTEVVEGSVGNLQAIDFFKDGYVAVSDMGWALTSGDGKNWKRTALTASVPFLPLNARALAQGSGRLVVCGSRFQSNTSAVAFLVSDNGSTWSDTFSPNVTGSCTSLIHDGARFLATTDSGSVLSSADGLSWAVLANLPGSPHLRAVARGAARYVVVGEGGYAATSVDGLVWTMAPVIAAGTSLSGVPIPSDLFSLVFDGTQFFAAGVGGARSPNGINWTPMSFGVSRTVRAIRHVQGRYIVVGDEGSAASSRDGLVWSYRRSDTALDLLGLVQVNGSFTAVGKNSVITTSSR